MAVNAASELTMDNVFILTNSYPYPPGEQFLETEIEYWSRVPHKRVTVIPKTAVGRPRDTPPDIHVDVKLAMRYAGIKKIRTAPKAIASGCFAKEIAWLCKNRMFSGRNVLLALRALGSTLKQTDLMRHSLVRAKGPIICYSYWFDTSAYAAALLRREGLVSHLITRAHGYDIYEERRVNQYMPLKRQFARDFDTIFAISEEGKSYMRRRYSIPAERLRVARLGVDVADRLTPPSDGARIKIISVAFCVPVKRVDRIIDAVWLAAQRLGAGVLVEWTHIGDGDLRPELEARAQALLGRLDNVTVSFTGLLPHAEVERYLGSDVLDVFINTSDSEGVPVSIMEAMSHGIPAIAPATGGIPELVNNANGMLLSKNPSISEIAEAICNYQHYKSTTTRRLAREMIMNCYCADKNYASFVRIALSSQ